MPHSVCMPHKRCTYDSSVTTECIGSMALLFCVCVCVCLIVSEMPDIFHHVVSGM